MSCDRGEERGVVGPCGRRSRGRSRSRSELPRLGRERSRSEVEGTRRRCGAEPGTLAAPERSLASERPDWREPVSSGGEDSGSERGDAPRSALGLWKEEPGSERGEAASADEEDERGKRRRTAVGGDRGGEPPVRVEVLAWSGGPTPEATAIRVQEGDSVVGWRTFDVQLEGVFKSCEEDGVRRHDGRLSAEYRSELFGVARLTARCIVTEEVKRVGEPDRMVFFFEVRRGGETCRRPFLEVWIDRGGEVTWRRGVDCVTVAGGWYGWKDLRAIRERIDGIIAR